MPVPDATYFGEKPEGGGISYGEVRKIENDDEKLVLLKSRLDTLLIRQATELTRQEKDTGEYVVWSPFILTIATFLAIETLGRVILDVEKIEKDNPKEPSKAIARKIYQLMDSKLNHKPTTKFIEAFTKLHNKTSKPNIETYSDVMHSYQRNTMNHMYQARGVYLSHELISPWGIENGYLIINPFFFWELFVSTYETQFREVKKKNSSQRIFALKYFNSLIQ